MADKEAGARDATLREIIAWCEQVADKKWDAYRADCGYERVRAGAAGDAYWAVAGYCREMLGHGGSMPLEVENQAACHAIGTTSRKCPAIPARAKVQ